MSELEFPLIIKASLSFTILCAGLLIPLIIAKTRQNLLHGLLFLHLISLIIWTLSVLIILEQHSIEAVRWSFAGAVLLATTKYYFVLIFPEGKLPKQRGVYLPLLLSIFLLIISFTEGALFKSFSIIEDSYIEIDNGPYSTLYVIGIMYLLISPIIILYTKYRKKSHPLIVSEQIKYLLYSIFLFFIIGLLSNSILPVFFSIYYFNGLGPAFALILVYAMYFIISRYRFLDLRILLQRSLVYSVLLLLVVFFYLIILLTLNIFFNFSNTNLNLVSSVITTIIAIFTTPYLERIFRKATDTIFFKDTYDYSNAVETFCYILNNNIDLERITYLTERNLESVLRAKYVKININNKAEETNKTHEVVIPLTLKNKNIGSIALGEKISGDIYSKSDLKLLNTLAYQLNISISRARLHKKLQNYSKMLEQKVESRTKDLINAYTHQQYVTHEVSHNLQTYLTVLKGELEIFRKKNTPESHLVNIEKVTDNISSFIYDFLELSQLESGSESFPLTPLNLSDLLLEILEYTIIIAEQNNIYIKQNITTNVWVKGNQKKLEELIHCVIGNSMKYTADREDKFIKISLEEKVGCAIIKIEDNGMGIKEEYLKNIFNRFYRCPNALNQKGSGLGLPIAKALVEKMNGNIKLESTENVGTICTINFPSCVKGD